MLRKGENGIETLKILSYLETLEATWGKGVKSMIRANNIKKIRMVWGKNKTMKILVLGRTGAIGQELVPLLAEDKMPSL